jgi:hypothetical protein
VIFGSRIHKMRGICLAGSQKPGIGHERKSSFHDARWLYNGGEIGFNKHKLYRG